MSSNRRSFVARGLVASAGGAALGLPSVVAAQQTFNWKMTSAYAKGAPF